MQIFKLTVPYHMINVGRSSLIPPFFDEPLLQEFNSCIKRVEYGDVYNFAIADAKVTVHLTNLTKNQIETLDVLSVMYNWTLKIITI